MHLTTKEVLTLTIYLLTTFWYIVAFQVYDIDGDGFISNGELFQVLKMMVGDNLNDIQLQQIVDKTILEGDEDKDGKISFEEFKAMITGMDDIHEKMSLTWADS